jgi:hypothetical protein
VSGGNILRIKINKEEHKLIALDEIEVHLKKWI